MFDETVISKGYQTVVPSKKRTLKDIIGLVKAEGDAVESKKRELRLRTSEIPMSLD